ncbi:uncharacterized protein LOC118189697 [Stegodyphus dumicola]|uniref:uncharacterized protein LOC118189697 n=1 Tax=Stegodyphus dumicola TaxID=202533 RepID=UPI0015AD0E34|nr:uncharacterized protein LOC118189697 [Stegodyphus dumicola]
MNLLWGLLVLTAFVIAVTDGTPLESGDVQEAVAKYLPIEEPEKREDKPDCIPEGGECEMLTGPNCCGIRLRCHYKDTQIPGSMNPYHYRPTIWINKCREYRIGIWFDEIGNWFSNLG